MICYHNSKKSATKSATCFRKYKMSVLDDTLKIEDYRGLYIKNTIALKQDVLTRSEYKKFSKEQTLYFVMQARVNSQRIREKLTPIKLLGTTVATAIKNADTERRAKIAAIKTGCALERKKITLTELWNEYTTFMLDAKQMTENYVKNNTYFYNKHLKPNFGDMDIKNITTAMLQKIINHMNKNPFRKKKITNEDGSIEELDVFYAPATVDQIKKVFDPMFVYAADKKHRYIKESPMTDVITPTYDNARDFDIPEEQEQALYKALMNYPELKFRGIFMFLLEGRRRGEVLSLTWDRVDLIQKQYYLPKDTHKGVINLKFTLPNHLVKVLSELEGEHKGYVFKSDRATKANGGNPGGKITNFDKRWSSIMKSIGIDDVNRHDMRHWLGNITINSGGTRAEVSYILGHSSERTAARYSKVRQTTAGVAVEKAHKIISKIGKNRVAKQSDLQAELMSELQQSAKDLQPDELTQILEMIRSNNNG